MIQLILLFCLSTGGECREYTPVTQDVMTLSGCMGTVALEIASEWVREHPNYVLRGWKCRLGTREERQT